ncbi:protein starmaker-like [Branchiostoma lanceolatum]|uniref:protein starmaker-like n=1 Tax=Branchiostoma lanceolatum TaxID=7740 RepID=UPI00345715B2
MAECLAECMENSTLQVELEILESIYLDELQVEHGDSGSPSRVEITLHPATADNVEAQFVRLTLSIMLPTDYPQELPSVAIQNPRGLSEQQVNSLYKSLQHMAQERQGESMLYEMIEFAKDSLTHNNLPSCECAICLYPFNDMDDFTKTECYHYFHCHCLGRYIQHTLDQEPEVKGPVDPGRVETPQNEVVCPMCREPINYDLAGLLSAKPPAINEDEYRPDKAMMRWQADMARVYKKQQSKGGIIDLEAERNKFFIKLETPRPEEDAPSDVLPVGTELPQEDPTGTDVEGGMAGIGVMAAVKTVGLGKTGNGERGATGTDITETSRPLDRKPRSAGFVPRDGKILGEMEKNQQRHEGERKVRSAGRGTGRYQGRRHSPRDGWRDRSKGGERRQYREGRKSPRDGEKVKIEVKDRLDRGNEEGKQAMNTKPVGKRDEQRFYQPRETKKGDSKTDDDFTKPEQLITFITGHKSSDQSNRSDRARGDVRTPPNRHVQPREGEEAEKRKDISTSDTRERQEKKDISTRDSRERPEKEYIRTSDRRERQEKKDISTSDRRERPEKEYTRTSDRRERPEKDYIRTNDRRERPEKDYIRTNDRRERQEKKGISTSDRRERPEKEYTRTNDRRERQEKKDISTSDRRERPEKEYTRTSDRRERPEKDYIRTNDRRERPEKDYIRTNDRRERQEKKDISTSDRRERPEKEYTRTNDRREQPEKDYIRTNDRRERQEKKGISTSDSRERHEKSYQNGFPEPKNEHRTITSESSECHSERYHDQQFKGREGDRPKKTQNRTRQQNRSQQEGRRADDEKKNDKHNTVVDKKQTHPSQPGNRNEKEDRKWNKSDHPAAKEVTHEARTVTSDKRHDLNPRRPPPGFEKVNFKKGFTRPPPGFDDVR